MWAKYSSYSTRTTNACEAFHSHLNKSFYSAHPNVDTFSTVLLRFQTITYIKMRSAVRASASVIGKEQFIAGKMLAFDSDGHVGRCNDFH